MFSPRLGDVSRFCTQLKNWTITTKKKAKESEKPAAISLGLTFQDGPAVPWSSVNNSTVKQKTSETGGGTDNHSDQITIDFDHMTDQKRREMVRRLRQQPASGRKIQQSVISADEQRNQHQPPLTERATLIADFVKSVGMELSSGQLTLLLRGERLRIDDCIVSATCSGGLIQRKDTSADRKISDLWKRMELRHNIRSGDIRFDPVGTYSVMLKKTDSAAWERLFGTKNKGRRICLTKNRRSKK